MATPKYPLESLGPEEIKQVSEHVRKAYPDQKPYFRVITLSEPPKKQMLQYLADEAPETGPRRLASVQVYLGQRISDNFWQLKVDVGSGEIVERKHLQGRHSHVDAEDMQSYEKACLENAEVQAAIMSLNLPPEATVVFEPWTYATDGVYDMKDKVSMCYCYARFVENPDANYYANPLDIYVVLSGNFEVLEVGRLPDTDPASRDPSIYKTAEHEYHPDLVPQHRNPLKPLLITQPDGPSFTVEGQHITWDKWSIHLSFNYREGLVLHNVSFAGQPLFYRLSLAEMFVPYGDPRPPYGRKAAFDLGNDGAGVNANNLQLGCDCLGHIHYFDGWHVTSDGTPLKLPNVVCLHEVDDGILWKHTNFRTGNAVVVRNRVLVLQTIITVSNYEYIFAWNFRLDASLEYEVRATGIVSTVPHNSSSTPSPHGIPVSVTALAPHHQHLFCLRIDPVLSSPTSQTIAIEEVHTLPEQGIGFTTATTPVPTESSHNLNTQTHRTFLIQNPNTLHPFTKTPISYALTPHASQLLLAHPTTHHALRSEFASAAIWVTRHHDTELFPSGDFTMQSAGGEGIASWIAARKGTEAANTEGEDVVLWHTFGTTHIVRAEDWPVMSVERMRVGLRPVNFWERGMGWNLVPAGREESGRHGASVCVNGGPEC